MLVLEIPAAALEPCQLKIKQFSLDILKFHPKHKDNPFTLNCSMVPRTFCLCFMQARWVLIIFRTQEKTTVSARVSRLIFPFFMTMIAWRCHGISRVYFYFLFRTSVKKYYMDERDLRHCCGIFSEKVILKITWLQLFGSSRLKMFLRKGVLKICSKFTGKHPCQSVIAIKLLWVFSCKFSACFHITFF